MINYYLLTKPGIIFGNLLAVAAGFLLASKGQISPSLFLATLVGLTLLMASSCVFNNYLNREIDKKMERTKHRALATGAISSTNALLFGVFLGIMGNWLLATYTNKLTVILADIGFFFYVVLYSIWKCRTIYGTAIGSIAGAIPPVVGYCAVSNQVDSGAILLFLLLVFWQMPHFFSIAVYRLEDYKMAGLPLLPIEKGIFRTKVHMLVYIIGFILVAASLTFFNYTGYFYLVSTVFLAFIWLALSMQGFIVKDDKNWAKQMFRISLLVITIICIIIPLDIISN